MNSQMILVAVQELHGGTKDTPHVTKAGTEVNEDEADRLGLSEEDVLALIGTGAIEQRTVRSAGESLAVDEPFDGVAADDFMDFADRHGIAYPHDATLDDILALDPIPFDGISTDDLRATLRAAGVAVGDKDDIEQLLGAAIEHGKPDEFDLDAAAGKIERDIKVDDIKEELGKLGVPFETDANKPALARLLAQVRHASPAPAETPPAA